MITSCTFWPADRDCPKQTTSSLRALAHDPHRHHIDIALDGPTTLDRPTFLIDLAGLRILTNGIAACAIARRPDQIAIADTPINTRLLEAHTTIQALETAIYHLAANLHGRDWLTALAKRSLPQIRERERRLSILRAHVRPKNKVILSAAITGIIAKQGTGTWI